MATAQGIRAGRAFVEIFADNTQLVRGLNQARKRLKAFGESVQSLGTKLFAIGSAATGSLLATTNVFASMGDQLAKMSARTGISVESLSELGYAAEQSGSSMEALETNIRAMQKFLSGATSGSIEAQEVLSRLGLSAIALRDLAPEQQFEVLADRLSRIQDPTMRAAMALKVFGKSGTSLLPLIENGADGIAELRQQARELGLVISTEDAEAAEEFGDRLSDMWKVVKRGVFAIGAALAPTLRELAVQVTRISSHVTNWINENKTLIVTTLKVTAAVAAIGSGLVALGALVSGVGVAFGMAASTIVGVGKVLGLLAPMIGALLSPIGLMTVAIAGVGVAWLRMTGAGAKALDWLSDRLQAFKTTALTAWKGISDALAAGDLTLAAKILWLTLRMEWQKGVAFLQEHWIAFKEFFLSIASEAFYGVVEVLINSWAGLQTAWVETTAFLADAWIVFTSSLTKGWNTAQNFISKGILRLMKLFDSSLDLDAATKVLDEEFQRRSAESDSRLQQIRGDRDRRVREQLERIEADRRGAMSEVSRQAESDRVNRERRNADELAAAGEALMQARKEWEDAIAEAARNRAAIDANMPEKTRRAKDSLANVDGLLEKITGERTSTAGTFSAIVAGRLGGNMAERTARATEQTAKNTKRIVDEIKGRRVVFE